MRIAMRANSDKRPQTAPNNNFSLLSSSSSSLAKNVKDKDKKRPFLSPRCASSPGADRKDDFCDLMKRIREAGPNLAKAVKMTATSDGQTIVADHLRLVLDQFCWPLSEQNWRKLLLRCRLTHRACAVDSTHFLRVVCRTSAQDKEQDDGEERQALTVEDYEALLFRKVGGNAVSVCRGFRVFDLAHDGFVQMSDLRRLTVAFCGDLGPDTVFSKFWKRYDAEDKGLVRYRDLLLKMAANALRYRRSLSNLNMKLALTWPDATDDAVRDDRIRRVSILRQEDDPRLKGLTLEEICKMVREQVRRNYDTVKRVLEVLDDRGEGDVSRKEFRSAVVHFTYPMSEAMFGQLCRSRNIAVDDARLVWQPALDKLCVEGDGPSTLRPTRPATTAVIDRDIEAILGRADVRPHNALRRWFTVHTKEGPHITRQELRCLLASLGCATSDTEWRRLAAFLDPGHGNLVPYRSLRAVLPDAPAEDPGPETPGPETPHEAPSSVAAPRRKSLPPKTLVSQLKHRLDRDRSRIEMALCACDPEQKGWIGASRFRRVLHAFCFQLTDPEFEHVLDRVSSSHGVVERKRFLDAFRLADRERLLEWSALVDNCVGHHTKQLGPCRVLSLFRQLLIVQKDPLLADMQKEDVEGKGTLRKFAFRRILDGHGCRLSDSQFASLWEKLPVKTEDVLDYNRMMSEFLEDDNGSPIGSRPSPATDVSETGRRPATTASSRCEQSPSYHLPSPSPSPPSPPPPPPPPSCNDNECEEALRSVLTIEWRKIFHQLQRVDGERAGTVPWQAFQDAMAQRGIPVSADPLRSVLSAKYGVRKELPVNYVRFLRQFFLQLNRRGRPAPRASVQQTPEPDVWLRDAVENMRPTVTACWQDLKRELRRNESVQRGILDATKFRTILKSKRLVESDKDFYRLVDRLDPDAKGQVDYRNFLRLFLKPS